MAQVMGSVRMTFRFASALSRWKPANASISKVNRFLPEKWLPVIVELSVSPSKSRDVRQRLRFFFKGSQADAVSLASRFGLPLFGRNHVVGLWSDGEA